MHDPARQCESPTARIMPTAPSPLQFRFAEDVSLSANGTIALQLPTRMGGLTAEARPLPGRSSTRHASGSSPFNGIPEGLHFSNEALHTDMPLQHVTVNTFAGEHVSPDGIAIADGAEGHDVSDTYKCSERQVLICLVKSILILEILRNFRVNEPIRQLQAPHWIRFFSFSLPYFF